MEKLFEQGYTAEDIVTFFEYLDALRESGATNMFGASPYVSQAFEVPQKKAGLIVTSWMKSFDPDKTPSERVFFYQTNIKP